MVIVGCSSAPWSSIGSSQRPVALLKYLSQMAGISVHAVDTHFGRSMFPIERISAVLSQVIQSETQESKAEGMFLLLFAPLQEYVEDLVPVAQDLGFYIVYDCMEMWPYLPGADSWYSEAAEMKLWETAVVSYTAEALLPDSISPVNNNRVLYLPNACDPSLWRDEPVMDVLRGRELTVGYIGTLGEWIDWDLAAEVDARTGTDVTFNFIGHGPVVTSNTTVALGYKAPELVRSYLQELDLLFVPFQMTELTRCVSPIKVYEALYCGVPVVVTGLTEVRGMSGVRYAENADAVLRCLANHQTLRNAARGQMGGRSLTWQERTYKLVRRLRQYADMC
jgi:glycosyltransferase involved in cell wall biosynthesis